MSEEPDLDTIDPGFRQDLAASIGPVRQVKAWLESQGLVVLMPETRVRPDPEQRGQYADHGDLYAFCLRRNGRPRQMRIEVQWRHEHFQSIATFPHDPMRVVPCHEWDNASPRPYAYVLVNQGRNGALIILGKTRRQWRRVDVDNQRRGRVRQWYECPRSACYKYITLPADPNPDEDNAPQPAPQPAPRV